MMLNAYRLVRTAGYWLAAVSFPVSLAAQQPSESPGLSVEQRLSRLERVVSSQALVEILEQLQRLQGELQELRGEAELQTHALQQVKDRQRELYLDIDRRLRRFEAGAEGAIPSEKTNDLAQDGVPGAREGPPLAAGVMSSVAPVQEQESYQAAFNLLKEGHYEKAIEGLNAFLQEYPEGAYADNAQYWRGEAYYVTRQYEAAMQAFQKLREAHPESPKVSHAELKMGYIYYELGQEAEAERMLTSLVERYPNTAVARLAQERLERTKNEQR
ncbi:MAG: tol-pal system protein YbgF [Gammaproteobacteria bacterium]